MINKHKPRKRNLDRFGGGYGEYPKAKTWVDTLMSSHSVLLIILQLVILYHMIASSRWLYVHRHLNMSTTFTHISDVWAWKTIESER